MVACHTSSYGSNDPIRRNTYRARKILNRIINKNYKYNFKRSAPVIERQLVAPRPPPKMGLRKIRVLISRNQSSDCSKSVVLI